MKRRGTPVSQESTKKVDQDTPIDVAALMAEIREQVREDIEKNGSQVVHYQPHSADSDGGGEYRAGHILHSEELRYLNRSYGYSHFDPSSIQSHRFGVIGKLVVKLKRKFFNWLWQNLMLDYAQKERDFQSNLVRLLNETARYVDVRDSSIFWELVRKVDIEVDNFATHVAKLQDEQMGTIRTYEKGMSGQIAGVKTTQGELRAHLAAHDAQLQTADSVLRGLESIVARLKNSEHSSAVKAGDENTSGRTSSSPSTPDYSYLLLENRFRGSEEQIAERLSIYKDYFQGCEKSVLEIGPGRGELLTIFKEAGIPSYGVDIDEAMVEAATEKGLDSRIGNALEHLPGVVDGSLGGVIAVQVVEHLTAGQLRQLFELCSRKVTPGGRIIFETINPKSLVALSSNYFRDPTHVWPQHPDTLEYAMSLAGIKNIEVRYLSPISEEAMLRPLPVEEHLTPQWAFTIKRFNDNIDQLNNLLYGYQDFCIIGEA